MLIVTLATTLPPYIALQLISCYIATQPSSRVHSVLESNTHSQIEVLTRLHSLARCSCLPGTFYLLHPTFTNIIRIFKMIHIEYVGMKIENWECLTHQLILLDVGEMFCPV